MSTLKFWLDADMGGDDAWLLAMALGAERLNEAPAHMPVYGELPYDNCELVGVSTVFGNTDVDHATENANTILTYLDADHVPVYQGASKPIDGSAPFGDGAYGDEGFCGVELLQKWHLSADKTKDMPAHRAMARHLMASDEKITILSSGPATNVARLIKAYPQLAREKIDRIILMSGAVSPGPDPYPATRVGNITEWAEFNAFQDPRALNIVFQSGINCDVIPMDTSHQMPVTGYWNMGFNEKFRRMTDVVANLDREKFGAKGPIVHDPNILAWALAPEMFTDIKHYKAHVDESEANMSDKFNKRGYYNLTETSQLDLTSIRFVKGIESPNLVFSFWAHLFEKGMQDNLDIRNVDNSKKTNEQPRLAA